MFKEVQQVAYPEMTPVGVMNLFILKIKNFNELFRTGVGRHNHVFLAL